MTKEITIEIKRPEIIVLLILLSAILILELQVTLNSPIVFGDEGFHTRMAYWIAKNKEYPVWETFEGTKLVKDSFSRPPLWNILEGSFYFIFGFHEVIVKFLTPFIASILIGLTVYLLGKRIYNKEVSFIAALIMVTVPSFVTYSVLFYTDVLFTFYFTLFLLTFMLSIKTEKKKYCILSGVFGALAFLTKIPGYTIFPMIGLGFLYQVFKRKNLVELLKKYSILIIILFLVIGPFFIRHYVYYKTPSCALPIFNNEGCKIRFSYKNKEKLDWKPQEVGTYQSMFKMGLINYFDFAYGNVWFVPLLFFCGLFIVFSKKSKEDILILLSIISFIPVLYIGFGGAEHTARYMLGLLPAITLICGIYLERIYNFIKNYYKWLGILVFIIVFFFSFQNLNGKLTTMKQVKQFSPAFLEACDFVKRNVSEDALLMTIWQHQSSYNCQRNIAGFGSLPDSPDIILSGDLDLTLSRLKAHGITHIFIQKFSISSEPVHEKYPIDFIQFLEDNPDNFVKIYENGPPLQQCIQAGGCDGNILYQINY